MINMGDYLAGETVKMPFNTYGANGESVTVTDLAVGDVRIYKDGGTTERASTSGVTLSLNHDGNTGSHIVSIDTNDNDDLGFYVAGSDYEVSFVGITVATQTLNPFAGIFSIENRFMRGTDGASTHNAAAVWAVGTRTLTSFGTLIADIWTNATRTITDKTGYSADMISVSGSTDAADKLEASVETVVIAAVVAGTLSITQMTTNLTEITDDHYNGRIIIWTSGVLQNQATDITDYDGGSKLLIFTAVTEAPSDGDTFVIV